MIELLSGRLPLFILPLLALVSCGDGGTAVTVDPPATPGDPDIPGVPAEPGTPQVPDTPETPAASPIAGADVGPAASLRGASLFPVDDPWNTPVDDLPVDPRSEQLIAAIGAQRNLHPDFGTVWDGAPIGIPYVVVPGATPRVPVVFDYADESDAGPYPIPLNPPIEGGPGGQGDRHILILDRDAGRLYELFAARQENGAWHAGSGAVFDLAQPSEQRPYYWTSADAAGLPIFPGLVRYDEVHEDGEIDHALRFTAPRTRRAFVAPARHWASQSSDPNLPPMGMRVRLKDTFTIPANWPESAQVIARALKRYGMILADNGSPWYLSGAPDPRWSDEHLAFLKRIKGSDFEVVQMGEIVDDYRHEGQR